MWRKHPNSLWQTYSGNIQRLVSECPPLPLAGIYSRQVVYKGSHCAGDQHLVPCGLTFYKGLEYVAFTNGLRPFCL